jgi:peptidoglycan-associated lipoprotein
MIHRLGTVSLVVIAAALAACSSTPLPTAAPVETRTPLAGGGSRSAGSGAAASGTPQSQVATVDLSRGAAGAAGAALLAAPGQRVVYFDFDSFAIREEFKPLIEGHARVLSANRDRKLVIEGHTDERGGREYNLALGQKRAESVLRSLALLGAGESQLEAVSFGKERPVAMGSNEEAWAKNRRAELKDR